MEVNFMFKSLLCFQKFVFCSMFIPSLNVKYELQQRHFAHAFMLDTQKKNETHS